MLYYTVCLRTFPAYESCNTGYDDEYSYADADGETDDGLVA